VLLSLAPTQDGPVAATPEQGEVVQSLEFSLHGRKRLRPRRCVSQEARPKNADETGCGDSQAHARDLPEAHPSPDGHRP
jgi:hypothetical protein